MMTNTEIVSTLTLEGIGKVPSMELRLHADGEIEYRYVVDESNDYTGFDGRWRVMSHEERREHLRMGGKIAEWLESQEALLRDKE